MICLARLPLELNAHRHQLAAVLDHLLHDATVVHVVVVHRLVDVDVGVAGDAEDRLGHDDIALEDVLAVAQHESSSSTNLFLSNGR